MASTKLSCIWRSPNCLREYTTGISLHGHTRYSKEKLQFIPAFTEKWSLLQWLLDRQYRKSVVPVDFSRAYWTSPLTPRLAFAVEKNQIERELDLDSLVSLTDHDSIQAPALLRVATETAEIPLSMEWSVPYCGSMFHLGVHNLPVARAEELSKTLNEYTADPTTHELTELLAALHALPEVLTVFNHPLWDLEDVGPDRHAVCLERFLRENNAFFHAFEINGMRKWEENKRVLPLAERWDRPIVSGGDRHTSEPSAMVNLSNAHEFAEFVHEVRKERRSHILLMPQYTEPMCVRLARAVLDVIRYYPEYPEGSRRWDDRVFHPDKSGSGFQPLSAFWKAPPAFIERIFSVFRLAENAKVQWAAKCLYADEVGLHLVSDGPSEAFCERQTTGA
ncbi:MAG: PHP domain-containing protein [Acidobacteriaceae bacterium]